MSNQSSLHPHLDDIIRAVAWVITLTRDAEKIQDVKALKQELKRVERAVTVMRWAVNRDKGTLPSAVENEIKVAELAFGMLRRRVL